MTDEQSYPEMLKIFSNLIRNYALHLIIFLSALFFIITITNPAVFFNDEWITLNQLRQLDSGHQVIISEGTYGVFKNGTSTPYFGFREQYLGYTLLLPLLSWPMLKIFFLFGDNFRYPVIFFWTLLPIFIILLLYFFYPQYARYKKIHWIWVVIFIMGMLFFLNTLLYYPFPFTAATAPREIAAVVFTNGVLFSLLCVFIFSICRSIFHKTWISLFGVITCIGCSSYIFWAANGKDHILTATIFSLCILFMVRYLKNRRYSNGIMAFGFIGLLAWARPEFAFMIYAVSLIFFILLILRSESQIKRDLKTSIIQSTLPIWTLVGAIPLFINNFFVTGNFFVPTAVLYIKTDLDAGLTTSDFTHTTSLFSQYSENISITAKLISFYSIEWSKFPSDIFNLLFKPENNAMSIVSITPVLITGIVLFGFILFFCRNRISSDLVLLYLISMIIAIPLAYIGNLHGLSISHGMTPDIRYLSPLYIPVAIFFILVINKAFPCTDWKKMTKIIAVGLILLAPAILILNFLFISGRAVSIIEMTAFYRLYSYSVIAISLLVLFLVLKRILEKEYFILTLGMLVSSPFTWHILVTFFFGAAKFNGYPFWVPISEFLFNRIIG